VHYVGQGGGPTVITIAVVLLMIWAFHRCNQDIRDGNRRDGIK
jgi:hypothetical protein